MDDHGSDTAESRPGRTRHSTRRKTVSGASLRDVARNPEPDNEASALSWNSPSAPTSPVQPNASSQDIIKAASHKRTFSGTLFSKLSFLRANNEHERPLSRDKESTKSIRGFKSRMSIDDDSTVTSPTSPQGAESAMHLALNVSAKSRKRKGSLRKTALLGGRRSATDGKERRNSLLRRPSLSKSTQSHDAYQTPARNDEDASAASAPKVIAPASNTIAGLGFKTDFDYQTSSIVSDGRISLNESIAVQPTGLELFIDSKEAPQQHGAILESLGSPLEIKSPTSQTSYASTTDDEEMLIYDRRPATFQPAGSVALQKPLSTAATSYFPQTAPPSSHRTRNSSKNARSPLSHTVSSSSLYSSPAAMETGHDYTETEYWGWVILFVTWLTFAVGMGSCLGIWSWAWDVNATPTTTPELEDDPTLPIVGYYPALIILTGVVAWIWITVAWVGMKYFRHAKIEV